MHRMIEYEVIQEIYHSDHTVIYRGKSLRKQQSVIIKTFKSEYPTLEEIAFIKHEYQIAKNLDLEGIVKPLSLENYGNGLALILEDVDGQSLQHYLTYKKIDLIDFLKIAIQLAQTLAELQARQITHKDLKSSNIIINPETGQVKITDFALASSLSKENYTNILEGTLAYMSPEQTGRMNRLIDYHTDYYSLGVTFYELLTNQLPFVTNTIELVHCHIAEKAIPPHLINVEVPVAVSEIVMKLLAKNAEDRYQTALGIKYDLEFCLTQLQTTGNILNFIVGTQDLSSQLLISQKLSGREQEVEALLTAFEQLATGSQEKAQSKNRLGKFATEGNRRQMPTEGNPPTALAPPYNFPQNPSWNVGEVNYPQFLSRITDEEKTEVSVNQTNKPTTSESLVALDLSIVLKASQAISEEIVLEKLIDKLMHVVTENTGVQKGLLFLQISNKLVLAAESSMELEKVVVFPFIAVDEYQHSPSSLINYVERTKDTVVLNNAVQEGLFTNDPYILKYQPKSVLSLPIVYQDKLTGILYLENRVTRDAFTHNILQVLSLLCSQISISIENANLYKDLQSYAQELFVKNQAGQQSEVREREKAAQLESALQELQDTQIQLIQSEKLSNLGQMVAGIAHEINNPVNFINVNLCHASNYVHDLLNLINLYQHNYPQPVKEIQEEIEAIDLEFLQEDLPKMLNSLKLGSHCIKEIVRSLRNFSRQDTSQMTLQDIHEGIDTTLMILQHRLKAQPNRPAIEIVKEYGNLPMVRCYGGLLNQVFMNLLTNAIDAIEETQKEKQTPIQNPKSEIPNFKIRICTEILDSRQVIIRIADNGAGMTEEVHSKLFNPFFTTKSIGKGTGIGLSISRQIVVEKHQGQINCVSALGVGTEFIIELPIQQKI
ncbi:MAG: protein kinase [Rhizonema sp. PD37]|nr:protein kinase [Rhizonema sp. PD37]